MVTKTKLRYNPLTGNLDLTEIEGSPSGSGSVPIGALSYMATGGGSSSYISDGWLRCAGQVLNQVDYPDLFDRIQFVNGPYTSWLTTTTFSSSTMLHSIFDGTKFVMAGSAGAVGTSTDGQTWSSATTVSSNTVTGLFFNSSVYVLCAGNSTYTSANLNTYSTSVSINANSQMMTYGNGKYLNAGNRYVGTSTDGKNWITRTPFGPQLAFGNSALVVGSSNQCLFTATNTTSGFSVYGANILNTSSINQVVFTNSLFIASSQTSSSLATSTDGHTWTNRTTGTTAFCSGVAYGNSVYVLSINGGLFRSTTDFSTYSTGSTGAGGGFPMVAFGNNIFLACITNTSTVYSSTNGVGTWTNLNSGTIPSVSAANRLLFANGLFILSGTTSSIATTTDGVTYTAFSIPAQTLTNLFWDGSKYVCAFSNGSVATSTDFSSFTTHTTLTTNAIQTITSAFGNYYVGGDNFLQTSTDLITWNYVTNISLLGALESINGAFFANGLYLLGTTSSRILTSTDGITFAATSTLENNSSITGITFGAGIYAISKGQSVFTSTDLTTFSVNSTGATTTQTLSTIAYLNNLFVAGGSNAFMKTSTDAISWDQISINITTQTVDAFSASTSTIVFGGSSGLVGYSLNTYPYNSLTQFQLPTDAQLGITTEFTSNFKRSLFIKATNS